MILSSVSQEVRLEFKVEDTGVGMPAFEMKKLLKLF
jgi:signal transduction histidine kinase